MRQNPKFEPKNLIDGITFFILVFSLSKGFP